MANSADPDQLASSEANWSGSTLFAKIGHVMFSKKRVNVMIYFEQRNRVTQRSIHIWLNIIKFVDT